MSARKRTFSGSKSINTPKYSTSSAVPNTRKMNSSKSLNMTVLEPVIVDPLQSQKYMQHKLDIAYNKYIQNLALQSILTKFHQEAERSYDEQLTHYEEMHETAITELEGKKNVVSDVTTAVENDSKLKFLESALDDIFDFMDENKTVQKINKINENMQLICDNLNFENITFGNTEEGYTKLQNILKEMSKLLEEINEGNNEDFNFFVENIFKAKDLITKIKKNHENANISQSKLNKLVLKTASLELSKTNENEQCSNNLTPIKF